MSRRTSAIVDLGPLQIRSGMDDQSSVGFSEGSRESDVARLEALLSRSAIPHQQTSGFHHEHYDFYPLDEITNNEADRLDKLSKELLISAEKIVTHASLELHDKFLKGIRLAVFEIEGRLQFNLVIKDQRHSLWLSQQLQNLAIEVGDRLKRPIRIQIIDSTQKETVGIWADWNGRNFS